MHVNVDIYYGVKLTTSVQNQTLKTHCRVHFLFIQFVYSIK